MKIDSNKLDKTQACPATKTRLKRRLMHYPFFLIAVTFSAFNLTFFVLMFYRVIGAGFYPKFLKVLLLPGAFPLYFLGTIFNSPIVGWTSCAVGMFGTYGLIGISLDLLVHRLKQKNRKTEDS